MSSPDQASNCSSRRTSLAPSSASSYLSVPSTSAQQQSTAGPQMLLSHIAKPSSAYVSPYPPLYTQTSASSAAKPIVARKTATTTTTTTPTPQPWQSAALASQEESEAVRYDDYTFPSHSIQQIEHQVLEIMFNASTITEAQKQALIDALNEHRINTLGELRRVERVFATLGSSDLTQPMTAAWMHYVNSHGLLTEIRTLSRNYPFSSECLDEAKRRVYQDPASNRSWNLAWLVLAKVHTDKLIPTYAHAQASRTEMWGGSRPAQQNIDQLTAAFIREWDAALSQLLKYWEAPPIKPAS